MNKKKSRSGSEDRDIPDHISENLETFFGLKILKFFDVDPDPDFWVRDGKIRIWDTHYTYRIRNTAFEKPQ
jgi:hypothetical protein